ncbi:4-O-methyltransferase 1 [Mycena sanguinolenta]|uniref:4-O-methyltransferase 1 n=1 Tax=Mycena sanguinolenta TaxID=230812 RepID=A0A8H6ZIY3_9AGAR|nr:4-O-methyltransferase 1 [Mycena sanguinolenta]
MATPLATLAQLISTGVQTLEAAYAKQGIPYPSLDAPFQPTPLDFDPALFQTAHLIIAAASQLIATVRSPMETIQAYAASMHTTSTLGFVVDADIPDVLKDAGPKGMHVKDLAAVNGIDADNQGTNFKSRSLIVAPNTFANNRISSLLIKAKSLDEIKADPEAKYDGAPIAAIAASTQASGYLSEFLRNPGNDVSPFNTAFKTQKTMWEWREETHNVWRARRFAVGMKGGGDVFPANIFTDGIGGEKLPADALVVDVGGSIGSVTPETRQSLSPPTKEITEGEKFWAESAPELIESGRVKLQVHNFFEPQPVKDAAMYFMRVVIHDWPDVTAKEIMANTRKAGGKESKLVLFDLVMPYACETPGAPPVPSPLLPNLGIAGAGFVTNLDIEMMTVFNGKERTVDQFRALGEATGWKLEEVKPGMLFAFVFSAV